MDLKTTGKPGGNLSKSSGIFIFAQRTFDILSKASNHEDKRIQG